MAKRSTNFNRGRGPIRAAGVLDVANWLGISEAEQRVIFGGAPLFVNINGEDTVPATITAGILRYAVGKTRHTARYNSTDIHPITDGGETWYEINDTALLDV